MEKQIFHEEKLLCLIGFRTKKTKYLKMSILSIVFMEYPVALQSEISHQMLFTCYNYLSSHTQKYIGIFLILNICKTVSKYYFALPGYHSSDCEAT